MKKRNSAPVIKKQSLPSAALKQSGAAAIKEPNSLTVIMVSLFMLLLLGYSAASYMRNRIYKTPLSLWRSMAESSPNKRRTHENFGQALSTVGQLDEALREFKTVLALPDDGSVPMRDLYREIGVVYFRMNRIDESIVAWKQGLAFAPNDPGLMNNLAVALMRTGQYDEAASYATIGLQGNASMPTLLNTLGEVAMHKGEFEKAVGYFAKGVEMNPDDTSNTWNAAVACERTGQYERAMAYLNRYLVLETRQQGRNNALELQKHLNLKMSKNAKGVQNRPAQ